MTRFSRLVCVCVAVLSLTSLASAEPLASRTQPGVQSGVEAICKPLVQLTRATYRNMTPVHLTSATVDVQSKSIRFSVVGIAKPISIAYADPVHYANMGDYAEYMRDRVGEAFFDSWTGAAPDDDKGALAAKLTEAQRTAMQDLARRAEAGLAQLVLHDTQSIWAPTGETGQSFRLALIEPGPSGCMDRTLGASLPRADLDAGLYHDVMSGENS